MRWETGGIEGPDREIEVTPVETPNTSNATLTNLNNEVQENLGENSSGNHLTESTQLSNEIQVWTQLLEPKNSDRVAKMKEEMDNKLEVILKEIKLAKVYRL